MLSVAAFHVLLWALVLGGPQQKPPDAVAAMPPGSASAYACDDAGLIRCSYDQVETVTGSRSLEDMRVIGKFIQLISERNRRYYLSWNTKAPSATYELIKRVKSFPYLPYNDPYAITGLDIVLNQPADRITVRYPRKPKPNMTAPIADGDLATYDTKLSTFIKGLEKEIEKLKKFEKIQRFPF
jgi:hypothetical protein